MAVQALPAWMENLSEEDLAFIKRFVLASGSLKEVARGYGVSYPTVRLRLDRLIEKVRLGDAGEPEPYIALIRRLAVEERIDAGAARTLIDEYRKLKEGDNDA